MYPAFLPRLSRGQKRPMGDVVIIPRRPFIETTLVGTISEVLGYSAWPAGPYKRKVRNQVWIVGEAYNVARLH